MFPWPGCRDTAAPTHRRWLSSLFQTETCIQQKPAVRGHHRSYRDRQSWDQLLEDITGHIETGVLLGDDISAFDDLFDGSLLDGRRLLKTWNGKQTSGNSWTVWNTEVMMFNLPGCVKSRWLKAGTHRPKRWTSEMFGKTWTSSRTNLLSCVGSFWNRVDGVWSDSTCKVWGCQQSEDHNKPLRDDTELQTTFCHCTASFFIFLNISIMIFQVMPSTVFHKRLLRSNEYWANTVCALFFLIW